MNERIKELYKQSGMKFYCPSGKSFDIKEFNPEKFAQLLTADLVKYLESEVEYYGNRKNYGPYDSYEGMRARADAINNVLKHVKYNYSSGGVES